MRLSESVPSDELSGVVDALVASSFDSIMVTGAGEGLPIVFVNEAFTELTGYTAEDVLGKSPDLLQGPDTEREVLDRLQADLAAGRVFEGETTNYGKGGEPFTMYWRVAGIAGKPSESRYLIAVQRREI